MTSPHQILDRQENASFSTIRQFAVLPGELDEFRGFYDDLEADIQPASPLEQEVFLLVAHAAWTLRRCRLAEAASYAEGADPLADDDRENRLQRIDARARRAQTALNRAMRELRTIQTERMYRNEAQPECDYPNADATMRSAGCLVDSACIRRQLERELQERERAIRQDDLMLHDMLLRGKPRGAKSNVM